MLPKFQAPEAPRFLYSRPGLLARLSRWSEFPLTQIAAPAGYGKTTLAAECLRGWGGVKFRDGVDPKYAIKLLSESGPDGTNRLRPEQPLAPGEYGFVAVTRGQPNMVEVFDFGID